MLTHPTTLVQFAACLSQLNVTYTPLTNVSLESFTALTTQPFAPIYGGNTAAVVNGTM